MQTHAPIDLDPAPLRRAYLTPESRMLHVAGVDVHIVDQGPRAAPAVVLLSAQWLGVVLGDRWAELVSARYRVIRIDLPGQGLTGAFPDGDYSAAHYCALVRAVLAELQIGAHVLVGTSFSGIAAAIYAADAPAGLIGLALATSSGLPRAAGGPSPNIPPSDPALAPVDGHLPRAFYAWKLATMLRRPLDAAMQEALTGQMHAMNELPGRAEEAQRRVQQYDPAELSAALPAVRVPVLVQWSSHSLYLPPDMAEWVAAMIPGGAQVRHYADTGHLLIADAPEETARDLILFVEGLS